MSLSSFSIGETPSTASGEPITDDSIRAHLPLVRRVVRRLLLRKPASIEESELFSWGLEGLFDAVKRFDQSKGVAFETYAQTRIRGSILDRLRVLDPTSRTTKDKAKAVEKAYRVIENRFGREASTEEVAEEMGMALEAFQAVQFEISRGGPVSIEDLGDSGSGPTMADELFASEDGDPAGALRECENRSLLARAVESLPEKESRVVALYYHEGMTMREVGEILCLTESRVSQLHSQALRRLRQTLSGVSDQGMARAASA